MLMPKIVDLMLICRVTTPANQVNYFVIITQSRLLTRRRGRRCRRHIILRGGRGRAHRRIGRLCLDGLMVLGLRVGVVLVDLVLVAEYVVVHVELLGRLRGQHERLHEATHGLPIVGQLAGDLHYNATAYGRLTVHLADLGVAVLEVEQLDLLVDLKLAHHGLLDNEAWPVDAAVHERGAAAVEAVQHFGRLVQHRVVLSDEFSSNLLRTRRSHDHDRKLYVVLVEGVVVFF